MPEPKKPLAEAGTGRVSRRGERRSVWGEDRAPALVVYDGLEGHWARLRDVSHQGIGLVLCHRVAPGAVLVVCLRCGSGALDVDRSVRVLNVEPQAGGAWRIGCAFTRPLNDDELDLVLRAADQRGW